MIIRATNTKQGMLKKITIVVLVMVTLRTYARHDIGNAGRVAGRNDGGAATVIDDAAHDLARGLIGHWAFDEGRGMITRDSSGRNNHGTIMGSAKWTRGIVGGALEFDGTDDFVSIPNERHFDITGSITVTAWIRVSTFTRSWQSIVTKGDRAWRLQRANNTNSLGWACSDLSRHEVGDLYGNRAVNDGRWHHVAGVHDGTKTRLFVDGTLDASEETERTISVNDYPVLIGQNAQQTGRFFLGLIDDVRIYDRALSADELQALFERDAASVPRPVDRAAVPQPDTRRRAVETFDRADVAGSARAGGYWPEFRGAGGDGHSDSGDLPLRWNETENVTWKTAVHDVGWSSPVVWENQVWMTTATKKGAQVFAVCIDRRTGGVLHDVKVFEVARPQSVNAVNSHASPTPTIEKGRLYVHYGACGTACLDTDTGKILWERRDLECDYHMGPGSSVILFNSLLIFNVDGADQQYVIALNKATGRTVWKTTRSVDYSGVHKYCRKAFSTPRVVRVNGQFQLISPGAKAIIAYDVHTGDELWKVRHNGWSIVPRPLAGQGLVFVVTDYDHPELWALRPDGRGDVTDTHVVWKVKEHVSAMPSLLLVDGLLYMISNNGRVTCIDAKTGEIVWKERIGGNYYASPIYAAGRIYLFNRKAETTVIEAGRRFKALASNSLGKTVLQATPAVVDNAFYLRTATHLYRIEDAASAPVN